MVFCAVDIYALISGYVWVNAKYRFRNIIELCLQVFCYSVLITFVFSILAPSSVSLLDWLKSIFPVMFNQYWYFSSYVGLFLFIPLLNLILNKMDKRQLQLCIGMLLLFFSCLQSLFFSDVFGTNDGYSTIWLMILYLVGGYIRKYQSFLNIKSIKLIIGYFMMVGITWLSKLFIEMTTLHFLGEVRAGNYFISYKSPFILLSAVFLLLFFEKMNISLFCKKIIKVLSPMSFGVYLIHTHPLIYNFLMKERFCGYVMYSWIIEVILVLISALCINFICYAINFIRLELFKILHIRKRLDFVEERVKIKLLR